MEAGRALNQFGLLIELSTPLHEGFLQLLNVVECAVCDTLPKKRPEVLGGLDFG